MSTKPVTFELTLTPDYVPSWGLWECLRELVANGVDGRASGFPLSISYKDRTVVITNAGARIERAVWLLGNTSKADGNSRGRFGEGLKISSMSGVRAGHRITFKSGTKEWEPYLNYSEAWGREVLTIEERTVPHFDGITVEIGNVPEDKWKTYRAALRCLDSTDDDDPTLLDGKSSLDADGRDIRVVWKNNSGTKVQKVDILMGAPKQVYCKGIWVQELPELVLGYDLLSPSLTLDRDRGMANRDELLRLIGHGWVQFLQLCRTNPAWSTAGKVLYSLLESRDDILDTWYLPTLLGIYKDEAKVLSDCFLAKHGEHAFPCTSESEVIELSHHAKRGVLVSPRLKRCLDISMGTIGDLKSYSSSRVGKVYLTSELEDTEKTHLGRAVVLLSRGVGAMFRENPAWKSIEDRIFIADLDGANGIHLPEGTIYVNRKVLVSQEETIRVLAHEVAHDFGGDGDKSHELAEGQLLSRALWNTVSP